MMKHYLAVRASYSDDNMVESQDSEEGVGLLGVIRLV